MPAQVVKLENERARRDPDWAPLPFGEDIVTIVKLCAREPRVAIIVAAPGLGKTCALRRAALDVPGLVMVTLDPTTRSAGAGLFHIRAEVAQHGAFPPGTMTGTYGAARGAQLARRDIADAFWRVRDQDDGFLPVLALDESQYASNSLLECCRALYDDGLCSLILCGNDAFRPEGLAPLISRATYEIHTAAPAAADVDAFLNHRRVADAKARALLHQVAARRGIRGVNEVLRRADPAGGRDAPSLAAIKSAVITMRFTAGS